MNSENADETPDSVRQAIKHIWKENPNLPDAVSKELIEVLETLQSLPFKTEEQRASLFESFQCLRIQGYHIVQVFKVGVLRLQKSVKEPSKFVAKVITLFQLCFNFCYKADQSKRVSFEYYIRALHLCFPSDLKKSCLSIETFSVLLNLAQILQEGKLYAASFIDLTKPAKGPKDLFNELLTILESKPYGESDVDGIISQASRLASADAENQTARMRFAKAFRSLPLQFDQIIPAVFFGRWIDLLQLTKAGDAAFILRVASEDPLHISSPVTYSPLCYMMNAFQKMKLSGEQVDLSHNEERLDAFFGNIKYIFENDYETAITLLKLLSSKIISDAVFAKVCKLFFKGCGEPLLAVSHKAQALDSIRQLLLLLPEGSLVIRVLSFWRESFPNDSSYATLQRLMDFFTGIRTKGSVSKGVFFQERAERLLHFIISALPRSTIPLIHSWATFLGLLITALPSSFEKLPGLPSFIGKVAQTAASQPNKMNKNEDGTFSFLNWLSKQRCSEEAKKNMAELFIRCVDPSESGCNLFVVDLIKSMCVCKPLPLNYMETFIQELVCFSSHLEPSEKDAIRDFVSIVAASDQSLDYRQDMFSELCITMKHLWNDTKAPVKSIRAKTFEIISLLAKFTFSSQKTAQLFQLSRNSTDGLTCCLRYLQLITSAAKIANKERTSDHFEILFSALFETLNGNENLCETFCRHHRSFTAFCTTSCLSVDLLNIWSVVVAGLLSLDLFEENVDLQGCMPVLARATGFDSPFHALQLYFLLRSVFSRLFELLKGRVPGLPFTQARGSNVSLSEATPVLVENFVEASILIVQSDVLTPDTKLLLIDKVCDIGLKKPNVMTGDILCRALGNVIPFHSGIRSDDLPSDHLELHHILTILERPGMLEQLAKISTTPSKSLYSILCSKIPNPIAKDDVVLIFDCVVFFKNTHKVFFDHLLVLLESIIKVCSSVSDVLDLLVEAERVIREVRPELIPVSILIFSYLVESKVANEERAAFIKLVALEWESPCDLDRYADYEIPQLLWNACQSATGTEGKFEAIDKIHEVIVRSKNLKAHAPHANITEMNHVQRSIACRDLEWLVLHSSLTCEDVALCFHLSSGYPAVHGLKCFSSVSAVQVQNGSLTPTSLQENEASKATADKHPSRVNGGTQGSVSEQTTSSLLPLGILTPAVIANKMIVQLRRLLGDDLPLRDIGTELWNSLFTNHCLPCSDDVCKSSISSSTIDDFFNVFLSVLEKASYLEVVLFWFVRHPDRIQHPFRSQHHVVQCSDVLLESCAWNGENVDKESHLQIQGEVAATLEVLRSVSEDPILSSLSQAVNYSPLCFRLLQPQLKCIVCILQNKLPFEVTLRLLNLAKLDWQAAAAVTAIGSVWSCQRATAQLLERVHNLFKERKIPAFSFVQNEFLWHMLEVWARDESHMNSPEDMLEKLLQLVDFLIPEEPNCGLDRLPEWRKMMIAEGYSVHVIDKWCADFLFTPRDNFSSRDVDAIIDLSPSSLQLVAPVSQLIKQCIFSEVGIKGHPIKERLRLVKVLNEFIEVLKIRKPNEASGNTVVSGIVVDACDKLCKSYLDKVTSDNDLYKVRGLTLDALFAEVFVTSDGERVNSPHCSSANNAHEDESSIAVLAAGQGKPPSVLAHVEVYNPMLVLLRRWLSNIASKPTLASYTQKIVQLILLQHSTEMGSSVLEELHNKIQNRILSFRPNQILISQLQAAGYNQRNQANANTDLWKSTSVELSCYLSKSESASKEVTEKKLTIVLRQHWIQWKILLLMLQIPSIRVGEADVDTRDLFGFQATLKEMENQVAAVKERICQAHSRDVHQRLVEGLTRQEQQHRDRINEQQKRNGSETKGRKEGKQKKETTKFVAVWENQFLENVQLCSERIPACYAPNGFHSEKPVLCALSVDNRILTVFKEKKPGRREEIENVEVKLFEAGMYVYGLHSSDHDYVTDELWAAFYKKLLEERLVPSIVLSHESPGFDWIKKFVQTMNIKPCSWELHRGIVPPEEDYFDHFPEQAALCHVSRQFLALTKEDVGKFQFRDFKDANVIEQGRRQANEIADKLKDSRQLQKELRSLHSDEELIETLARKLQFAVKETVKLIVNGDQPTTETILENKLIDKKKTGAY